MNLLDIGRNILIGVTAALANRAVDGLPQRVKLGSIFGHRRLEDADLLLDIGQGKRGPILRLLRSSGDTVDKGFEAFVHGADTSMEGPQN